MSDPFADYGHRATTTARPRLIGLMATKALARQRYSEILQDLARCQSASALEECLRLHDAAIIQFKAELEFLWFGDGMFLGLEKEIAWATARVDDRLDYPRWEPVEQEEGTEQ